MKLNCYYSIVILLLFLVNADIAREAVNKVLDKARSDIDLSKKEQFTNAFAAFIRSQGIVLESGMFFNFLTLFTRLLTVMWRL